MAFLSGTVIRGLRGLIQNKQARGEDLEEWEKEFISKKLFQSETQTHNIFSLENVPSDALFWIVLMVLGKKDPKSVERILTSLFNNIGDALDAYCRAGVGNRISAWGSGRLLSLTMERFGLITQPQAMDFASGINIITGAEVTEELATLLPWKSLNPDIDFPTTVVMGSKARTFRAERKTKMTKKGEVVIEEEG